MAADQVLQWVILLPALAVPLLLLARHYPNVREAVSLLAAIALFALVVLLLP